jgi:hypothetical protein
MKTFLYFFLFAKHFFVSPWPSLLIDNLFYVHFCFKIEVIKFDPIRRIRSTHLKLQSDAKIFLSQINEHAKLNL